MAKNKCLQPNSIPVPIELARSLRPDLKRLATDAAIFVQQIHYWICKNQGEIVNGVRWVYNAYHKWCFQLSGLSDYSFRKIRTYLISKGLIESKQLGLRHGGRDRSCWYTVNYNHEYFQNSTGGDDLLPPDEKGECQQVNTETSTKISSETNTVVDEQQEIRQAIANAPFSQATDYPEITNSPPVESLISQVDHSSDSQDLLEKVRDHAQGLSGCLQKAVLNASIEVVQNAIAAFDEAIQAGKIRKPIAYLLSAIRGGWKPALPQLPTRQKEFLDVYEQLITTGVVARIDVRHLTLDSYGEPLLRPLPVHHRAEWDNLVPWRQVKALLTEQDGIGS